MTTAGEDTLRPMQLDEPEIEISKKHATLILINVCVGQFIVGLDQRALLVALPTLTQTFNTSLTTIQWVLLIYDLLLIGTVITLGRLGDLFGRRRVYGFRFEFRSLWHRSVRIADYYISRFAGHRWRDDLGQWQSGCFHCIASQSTRKSHGHCVNGFSHRFSNRSDPGRIPDRHRRLALDFLSQPTHRDLGRVPRLETFGRKQGRR